MNFARWIIGLKIQTADDVFLSLPSINPTSVASFSLRVATVFGYVAAIFSLPLLSHPSVWQWKPDPGSSVSAGMNNSVFRVVFSCKWQMHAGTDCGVALDVSLQVVAQFWCWNVALQPLQLHTLTPWRQDIDSILWRHSAIYWSKPRHSCLHANLLLKPIFYFIFCLFLSGCQFIFGPCECCSLASNNVWWSQM